jgi:ubiquinone/menaquinone biosynthesis C-methylase UbiE
LDLLVVIASVVVAAAWQLYSRRPRERIPSHESMDDPEVNEAFDLVSRMPQMHLMRWYVARRALRMSRRGEAADLGCGPGLLAIELARMSPELAVIGVDLSEEMLAQADGNAQRSSSADRISFRRGDAAQVPFPDGSLDLVVSTLSLHHWSDPVAVLDEVSRVVRPGGSFLIFDLRRDLGAPAWLLLWFGTCFAVPAALRRIKEPMSSRNAAYTPQEAARLAEGSRLADWRVTQGPLWLTIEGTKRRE